MSAYDTLEWGCVVDKLPDGSPSLKIVNYKKFSTAFAEDNILSMLNGINFRILSNAYGRQAIKDGLSYDDAVIRMIDSMARKYRIYAPHLISP